MPTELSRLKYLGKYLAAHLVANRNWTSLTPCSLSKEGIDLSGTSLAGPFPLLLGDLSYLSKFCIGAFALANLI